MTETLIVILMIAVLGVIAFLLWLTIRSQKAQQDLSAGLQNTVNQSLQSQVETL